VSIIEIFPADVAAPATSRRRAPALPSLPAVAPGQLWLVELPAEGALPEPARRALAGNVVIYDRALADTVADSLSLGGYAEPAAAGTSEAVAARALRFARDGWSVARLFRAGLAPRERTRLVQDVVDELAAVKVLGRLPVLVFAEAADGIEERIEARFDDLAAIVVSYPRDTRLTIVIDAFTGLGAPGVHAIAGNGLAG
jgi:hypothetical protein